MIRLFEEDTICAIATPSGEGGIGIIKISGHDALPLALRIFRPSDSANPPQSRRLCHGWIIDPDSGQPLDEVLLSYLAAPRTYTREDIVEVNCHSGYAVLCRLLDLIISSGARLAEPGEFTRRAFLNGRIDLSQAEAVIDVIRCRSHQSLLVANRHLRGEFRDRLLELREALLQFQAEIEAAIDFVDDIDDASSDLPQVRSRLFESIIQPLKEISARYEAGRLLREGLTLVLVGKPNVGKSSLLNALLGKDRAIVTPFPGTTRDVIEDSFTLSGAQVRILDTAGIRNEPDEIESLGIERTIKSVAQADVVLWLIDQSRPLTEEDDAVFGAISSRPYVVLLNKADLPPLVSEEEARIRFDLTGDVLMLSVFDPPGIDRLRGYLGQNFLREALEAAESSIVPNLRHKECADKAIEALERAGALMQTARYDELISIELNAGRKSLDRILGLDCEEDILDRIFSRFCIGK
jgi:tRNA modification GTPase